MTTLGTQIIDGLDGFGVRWSFQNGSTWHDGPESDAQAQQKARGNGGWSGEAFDKARHDTFQVLISAPSIEARRAAQDRLKAAATKMLTTLTMDDGRYARVKRDGAVLFKILSPTIALASVMTLSPDPRRFGSDLTASTGLPSTTGGRTIPFTIPFTINAVTVTGQVSLTNPGNASGPVRLRIDGPVTAPVVTHVSSGNALVFSSSLSLGAGEFVTVDMEAHSVLAQGQASRAGWVVRSAPSFGWSQFDPGPNTWAFAAGATSAALLTVTATPAWD